MDECTSIGSRAKRQKIDKTGTDNSYQFNNFFVKLFMFLSFGLQEDRLPWNASSH